MIKWIVFALPAALVLDLLLGDPAWLYHPVRIMGSVISFLEKWMRKIFPVTDRGELMAGGILTVLVCTGSFFVPWFLLKAAFSLHTAAGVILETFMCYQMLAVRSLKSESMKVYYELEKHDLEGARKAVSMIVGRDTQVLDEKGVTKAAVETIAENTSDGIVAPMFYMALGGPALMFLYKAVNTMDSMLGYKNEKYLYFGRFAARLDDVANFIPSRLSGIIMILSSGMGGFHMKNAWKIFKRDRFKHASPNSAQTEAVMAGALDIQLAGNAWYFGREYQKPSIGDALRPVEITDIKKANKLLYISAFFADLLFACIQGIVMYII